MKLSTVIAALLLLLLNACTKKEEAQPDTLKPVVIYTDANGTSTNITSFSAMDININMRVNPDSMVKAVAMRAWVPNGKFVDLFYFYGGTTFPASTGSVALTAIHLDFARSANVSFLSRPNKANGTLTVESTSPNTISATYTGSIVPDEPAIKLSNKTVTTTTVNNDAPAVRARVALFATAYIISLNPSRKY